MRVDDVRLSQALLEVSPDLIFLLDREGTILDYEGPVGPDDLLVPPEVFMGKKLRELLPPMLGAEVEERLAAARETGTMQAFEYELPMGGERRFYESRLVVYRDELFVAVVRDISERKAVEDALQASEEKYRLLFDAAMDAMLLVDAETHEILDANPAASAQYGYDHETLLTMKALELSARPDASLGAIRRTLETEPGRLDVHQNLHRRQDGSTFHVDISAAPVELSGRRAVFAVFRDVSVHVRAAHALAESRERFRQLAEHIREVFWLFDWVDGKVLYVSPTYEEVWGRPASDLYDRYEEWTESIHPDDREAAAASFDRIVETDGGESREYRVVRPDGEIRWVADRGFAIRDAAGQVVRIAGLAEDITARKAQEEERDALITELERANAELERFAYTVSHDLKSPLITIRGFLGYVARDIDAGDVARAHTDLERVTAAADKMGQLLNELLALSRVGRVVNASEDVPLADLAHEVVAQMTERLAEKGTVIAVDPSLPTVTGDRVRLGEVFENLIDNALSYSGDQPEPRVDIGVRFDREHGETPVIIVRDNGMGIAAPYQKRIFRLFEKLDPSSPGSGIGLTIVRRIVEYHNGRVWIESAGSGRGTTVCFTLVGTDPEAPVEAEGR